MLLIKPILSTIIFTDLDGTLLDHDTYSFDEATFMLDYIKSQAIPLIIVTSKTRDEVLSLQKKLNINTPFIIENGAGIIFPQNDEYKSIALGFNYEKTKKYFNKYAKIIDMYGFFEMSIEEIMNLTDLEHQQAKHAKNRTYSEPFILKNVDDFDALQKMAQSDGFDIVKGGRFYHLITKGQDKAAAVKKLVEYYETHFNTTYRSIALGDSANDLSMLQSVDVPILIPHFDGTYLNCNIPNLIKAQSPGSSGWNSALKEYFHV